MLFHFSETQNRYERLLLTNSNPVSGVAFSAYKSSSFNAASFGKYRELVYDKTECNVGNGYSTFTGTFTASISGTYAFTWTTCAGGDNGAIGIELVINNMVHGLLWTDSQTPADEECSTGFIIRTLNTDDVVFTRSQNTTAAHLGTIRSDEYMRTTFSGWLLF
ncbi:C1QL [Mytilus coruscus]|uniref:C1QL n=1 Tax=Mytilus coruscus TaxID=42192 RepID=A0A6J8D9P1_MYTCO|nr:C1QL [Mytilus coruscus]